jgi:hypothetical protein
MRDLNKLGGVFLSLNISPLTDDDRATITSRHLLQSVDAFLIMKKEEALKMA